MYENSSSFKTEVFEFALNVLNRNYLVFLIERLYQQQITNWLKTVFEA
jgi:hypothetical protein